MFTKILIANRGEIACRVMRTAARLGIGTVAVYSEADEGALHVRVADEAVCVGPAPAAQSYLAIDRMIEAARQSGAEAVHPGYGFLAENEDFARALAAAGIVFIGPGPEAIKAMGDKTEAKKLARAAGIDTVPGHPDTVEDGAEAARVARDIGYPVMIKAAAGGGGKGMRAARDEDELGQGFARALSEAQASFGDGRVFIEKFIEGPRHVEIQVLADGMGNVIHLGERECSIQRRHQKVIEEAPSPLLDEATRAAMGEQAVRLARQVGYRSAGTVEFIVDRERRFYFLEMNTRLQVEHPVTELVTGVDLVEEMIRIAAGEALGLGQDDVRLEGWAIESRVYAEDPRRGFLPSVGRLVRYLPPPQNAHVRVDSGIREGSEVSVFYDPLIAKVCTLGATREEAIERMGGALDAFYIRGVEHNLDFLAAVMAHPLFREGRIDTDFIDTAFPEGFQGAHLEADARAALIAVAAVVHCRHVERDAAIDGRLGDGPGPTVEGDWVASVGEETHRLGVRKSATGYDIEMGGEMGGRTIAIVSDWRLGEPLFRGTVEGRASCVEVERLAEGYRVARGGARLEVALRTPRIARLAALTPRRKAVDASDLLRSPMPGLVISINVEEGQEVKAGEPLAVVEAMKMENVLRAEHDGTVARVLSQPGDSLVVDQVILEFE